MRTLILTSGGDAPGINLILERFTHMAARHNTDAVLGARGSFAGLLDNQVETLEPTVLSPLAALGGSYLPSSRVPVLKEADAKDRLLARLDEHQIDNLLLLGGNGTLRNIPPLLRDWGIPVIGIPTTIDNDVPGTEMTIGHDSACNYAYSVIDNLKATAFALRGRLFTVETLGGNTGFIALAVARASGAQAVLMPEIEYDHQWLAERVRSAVLHDDYALVVLSEGVANARTIAEDLAQWANMRVRDTRLGHGQRGTAPSHADRLLAVEMTAAAHKALRAGQEFGIVAVQNGRVMLHDDPIGDLPDPTPDHDLYNQINGL